MTARHFAYADPPYLGCAKRYYGDKHPDAAEYDEVQAHAELIAHLVGGFPDGWALSCHVPSLQRLLALCPDDVRVAAWVKPFSGTRPGIRCRFAWEPVIFCAPVTWDHGPQFVDVLSCSAPRRNSLAEGFPGRKPEQFTEWVCDMLGLRPGDTLTDLFEGSGAVARAVVKVEQRNTPDMFELAA